MAVADLVGPHVVLLATGGTISSRGSGTGGAAVASDTGEQVFASLGVPAAHPVRVVDVFRKGSYLLTVDDMIAICVRIRQALADPQVLGVVVTHGTDTMEETSYLVDLVHDDPRPVVFTGAQQAADAEAPDGPGNLSRAIAVAGSPQTRGSGVLLAFAGTIFPAAGVRKSHTTRLDAFANPDFGIAGSVSDAGEVTMHGTTRGTMRGARHGLAPLPLPGQGAGSPRVDLIAAYPGADSTLLRASLQAGRRGLCSRGRERATQTVNCAGAWLMPRRPASWWSRARVWTPAPSSPDMATAAGKTCARPAPFPPGCSGLHNRWSC
jgi:L-asparaginase